MPASPSWIRLFNFCEGRNAITRRARDRRRLADEREHLLWGFVSGFDTQVRRLDRSIDKLTPGMPKVLVAFEDNGITGNLVDKARRTGIPVLEA